MFKNSSDIEGNGQRRHLEGEESIRGNESWLMKIRIDTSTKKGGPGIELARNELLCKTTKHEKRGNCCSIHFQVKKLITAITGIIRRYN